MTIGAMSLPFTKTRLMCVANPTRPWPPVAWGSLRSSWITCSAAQCHAAIWNNNLPGSPGTSPGTPPGTPCWNPLPLEPHLETSLEPGSTGVKPRRGTIPTNHRENHPLASGSAPGPHTQWLQCPNKFPGDVPRGGCSGGIPKEIPGEVPKEVPMRYPRDCETCSDVWVLPENILRIKTGACMKGTQHHKGQSSMGAFKALCALPRSRFSNLLL